MSELPNYIETSHGTKIAYHRIPYHHIQGAGPGIVWLGGFMSDMNGSKALALEAYAKQFGQAYVRFDYMGHGLSSGEFADGTIGLWLKDALAIIDHLTSGPQILVGSSMGGWLALLAAKARPNRIKGIIGVAAAPDFTVRHWAGLSSTDQATIVREGRLLVPSDYGPDPYIFTHQLFLDGYKNRVMNAPLHLDFPIRLIQGMADPDVPWQTALNIANNITGDQAEAILIPNGDHRLSRDVDIARLIRVVKALSCEV